MRIARLITPIVLVLGASCLSACSSFGSSADESTTTTEIQADPAPATSSTTGPATPTSFVVPVTQASPIQLLAGVPSTTWTGARTQRLALGLRNNSSQTIGALTARRVLFELLDARGRVVWNDQSCVGRSVEPDPQTGFVEVEPGGGYSIESFYPSRNTPQSTDCLPPPGDYSLRGQLTACVPLEADWTCKPGNDRVLYADEVVIAVRQ